MAVRYRVTLTAAERTQLETLAPARRQTGSLWFRHARVLLLCDQGPAGPGWTVAQTATALGVSGRTVERVKKRFVEEGLEASLRRKPRETPPRPVQFDGAFAARLIALTCTEAPAGPAHWTLRLLAHHAVALGLTDAISPTSVHHILQKTRCSPIGNGTGASRRRRMPSSERAGRMYGRCITGPPTRAGRWCAWTRLPSHGWGRGPPRCREAPGIQLRPQRLGDVPLVAHPLAPNARVNPGTGGREGERPQFPALVEGQVPLAAEESA